MGAESSKPRHETSSLRKSCSKDSDCADHSVRHSKHDHPQCLNITRQPGLPRPENTAHVLDSNGSHLHRRPGSTPTSPTSSSPQLRVAGESTLH